MKTWSIDEMLDEDPCDKYHDRDLLERLWAGRERLSILDVLRLSIPADDRLWVATRPGALDASVQSRWIEGIVTRAINRALEVCDVPEFAAWASRWLDGTDRSAETAWESYAAARAALELAGAAEAAMWAARAAARAAEAGWAAAGAAARAAMWAATWAAEVAEAAEAAEREQQVADLVTILEEEL